MLLHNNTLSSQPGSTHKSMVQTRGHSDIHHHTPTMCGAASLKRKPSRSDISGRAGQPEQPDTDSAFQRTDRDIDRLNTAPSLFQIIRDDCRLRLYVPPLQWTSVHLEVLGHQFVHKTEIPHKGCKPRVSLKFHEHDAELPAEEIAKFLRRTSASVTRSLLLRELVARLGLRLQELRFVYIIFPPRVRDFG